MTDIQILAAVFLLALLISAPALVHALNRQRPLDEVMQGLGEQYERQREALRATQEKAE